MQNALGGKRCLNVVTVNSFEKVGILECSVVQDLTVMFSKLLYC